MKFTLSILLFVLSSFCLIAQEQPTVQDSSKTTKVKVRNADNAIFDQLNSNSIQYLKGNVKVSHDSIYMHSDSATLADDFLTAVGKVIIIQNDTMNIFADSMAYDSKKYLAKLFNNVVIDNGTQQLFSDVLFYNTKSKIATYRDTAIMQNSRTKLTSKSGRYNANTKMAYFKDQVVVKDDKVEIHADSLDYDMGVDKLIFKGPTWISKQDQEIYCEDGYYSITDGKGYFTQNAYINDKGKISKADEISFSEADSLMILTGNASYVNGTEKAIADQITFDESKDVLILTGDAVYTRDESVIKGPSIVYDTKNENIKLEGRSVVNQENKELTSDDLDYNSVTKKGYAQGNVIWNDTVEQVFILSDHLKYDENTSYYKAYGDEINPIFLKVNEEDSMFLSADTLISQKTVIESDTIEEFTAYKDVKIWKTDMKAIADSLFYSSIDSTFKLFGDPIIWADSSQYTGDTIFIKMEDNKVKQIDAFKNGFIINLVQAEFYDQVKGKHITSYLDSNKVKKMDVVGNAESIYFLKDENEAFVGANNTKCSSISFFFMSGELEDIKFYQQTESSLTPMAQCNSSNTFLSQFKWSVDLKPSDQPLEIRLKTDRKISGSSLDLQKNIEIDSTAEPDQFEEAVNDILKEEIKKKGPKKK